MVAEVKKLSERDQDAIAKLILDELADEVRWDDAFANSQIQVAKMGGKSAANPGGARQDMGMENLNSQLLDGSGLLRQLPDFVKEPARKLDELRDVVRHYFEYCCLPRLSRFVPGTGELTEMPRDGAAFLGVEPARTPTNAALMVGLG